MAANNIVAIVVIAVGVICLMIGMWTNNWSTSGDYLSRGLFQNCVKALGRQSCFSTPERLMKKNQKGVQTGASLALFGGLACLIIAVVNLVLLKLDNKVPLLITLASIAGFFCLVCIAISAIIWVATIHDPSNYSIGYSLIMAVFGGILIAAGGSIVNTHE